MTDVANRMNCTKPSVNKSLKILKENGYINYETYGEIKITPKGENLARKIIEAYDVVYIFLKEVLGLNEDEAKIEAEKMKSSMADTTINSLAKYVHKELDLNSLDCAYDINNEKCRTCVRSSFKKII